MEFPRSTFQGTVSGGSTAALMSIKKGLKESIGLCNRKSLVTPVRGVSGKDRSQSGVD